MSPKASSDFGLYKEKHKENRSFGLKFVLVVLIVVSFLFVTIYALVYFMGTDSINKSPMHSQMENSVTKAEKLILSQSVKRDLFQNGPPKPFGITFRGQPPSEFTSTTEKITTLNYPQLSNFRNRYYPYPNNIQDIIGYSNRFNKVKNNNKKSSIKSPQNYQQSSSRHVLQNKKSAPKFTINDNDPFFMYKPKDPSDINLLATANFRFAPPPWRNLNSKVYSSTQYYNENTKRRVISNNSPKPLTLTLNIYPNEQNGNRREHVVSHETENLSSKIRFAEDNHKKMVIHVNLYPNDETVTRSNLYGKVLTTPSTTKILNQNL